jgi:hypothetical protein
MSVIFLSLDWISFSFHRSGKTLRKNFLSNKKKRHGFWRFSLFMVGWSLEKMGERVKNLIDNSTENYND